VASYLFGIALAKYADLNTGDLNLSLLESDKDLN